MFPTILELGPFTIRSYGLLLAISFLVGVAWSARRARRAGLDGDVLLGMAWVIVVSGVLGARILYVLQHTSEFASRPLDIVKIWQGGLTLYGGLILATASTVLYLRRHTDRAWAYTDALAPFVPLGEGITRIGCFLNGCCFGSACTVPWGVTFPPDSFPAHVLGPDHLIHPSQIYQSLIGFAVFSLLSFLWFRRRWDGQVFWAFVAIEGVARFVGDFARYYEPSQRIHVLGLTLVQSQLTSILVVCIGLVGYAIRRRRTLDASAPGAPSHAAGRT